MAHTLGVTRRFKLIVSLALIGLEAATSRVDVIDLPMGFFPEGITRGGEDWTAYVGSLNGKYRCHPNDANTQHFHDNKNYENVTIWVRWVFAGVFKI